MESPLVAVFANHQVKSLEEYVMTTSPFKSTMLKWKIAYLLLQSLTDFLVLVLCNVHISSHPLNKQQEQITLPEGEKFWFYVSNGEGLEPIVLLWKCHSGNIMKLLCWLQQLYKVSVLYGKSLWRYSIFCGVTLFCVHNVTSLVI